MDGLRIPLYKIASFWNEWKGVKNPIVLYVMIPEVLKDTRSSWLGLHNLKSMWMAQGSLHLPRFKLSASLKNLKGVKNPPVLYVMIAEIVKDTGSYWLGFHNLKCMCMSQGCSHLPKLTSFLQQNWGFQQLKAAGSCQNPGFAWEKPVGDPRLYTFFNKHHINILEINLIGKEGNF